MSALYDTIGLNYADLRRPDARIAAQIETALGAARSVINVGAGAGSYEPTGRQITAVEPSAEMIAQRTNTDAVLVQGHAETLPFDDQSFDAAMAVLTIHHWSDQEKGTLEMRRVARDKVVFLTFDPQFHDFWLTDYFPQLITLDEAQMPRLSDYESWLGPVKISPVPIPTDCTDGFLAGYWSRPQAYLDPRARSAMSSFWKIDGLENGLAQLEDDLRSGRWEDKYGDLLHLDELDCGYRLVETA